MVMSDQVRHRRRGEELERALLDAAWEELATVGFASLTMESVAARAKTGVAVLYRRWSNKDELVLAAIVNYRETHQVETPDTGTLRGDLLALLDSFSDGQSSFRAVITASFAGLQANSGMTPAEVRGRIIQDQPIKSSEIYRRAHERGEIDLDRIPEAVLSMPFDLMRHELLMTLTAVPRERIISIVDDLFLPLAAQFRPVAAQPGQDLRPGWTVRGRPRLAEDVDRGSGRDLAQLEERRHVQPDAAVGDSGPGRADQAVVAERSADADHRVAQAFPVAHRLRVRRRDQDERPVPGVGPGR
jgi:AcrR family transcriptional regulator